MIALLSLLTLITVLLIVSRVATVALVATGMARDSAEFQARSALMGVGFTTAESEDITSHPLRRRIVLYLISFGNVSIVTGVGGFLLTFVNARATETVQRSALLAVGIGLLLAAFHTGVANRLIESGTRSALGRFTSLDTRDYAALLRFDNNYAITELHGRPDSWFTGRPLADLHLTGEGVVVLGVHRANGRFDGIPTGVTVVRDDDWVIAYGRIDVLRELAKRSVDDGDAQHERQVERRQRGYDPQ